MKTRKYYSFLLHWIKYCRVSNASYIERSIEIMSSCTKKKFNQKG
jgi:hypothetical protein